MPETPTIDAAEKAYAEASEKVAGDKPAAAAPVAAKPAAEPKPAVKAKAVAKSAKRAAKPAPAKPAAKVSKPKTTSTQRKDKTMATTTKTETNDFTAKIQTAVKDAQGRAKAAFDKGQAQLADAGEFSKGNFEALVESGKILGAGLQTMAQSYVEDVKSAFAAAQDDFKALTAVKSPSEFVELRRAQLRKQFDAAVAYNSKNAEAVLKLATEAFQPLSNRVTLAVEKLKQAA